MNAAETSGTTEVKPGANRRSRIVLGLIIVVAAVVLAAPPLMKTWMERDLCPSEVTSHGFAGKGGRWEISRADCGGGRIVHQLRIVPPKGWSVPVYDAEGGPVPVSWEQTGFVGSLGLERPLAGEATATLEVSLDGKGRPKAPIVVRDGRRVATP